ncbi:6-bladed beta-propeller [Peijinzhouia sedimentorum]
MPKYLGFCLLWGLMFFACDEPKYEPFNVSTIELEGHESSELNIPNLEALEIAFPESTFEVIVLEFTPNSMLGDISKVLYADNKYIVLDESSGTLFAFAKDGKYLFTIGSKGSGPDQYMKAKGFDLDADVGEIVVLDITEKIVHYNLTDGAYIKDYRLEDMPYAKLADIKLIGKDSIFLAKGKSSEILFPFDLMMVVNGKVESGGFPNTSPMDTIIGSYPSKWFSPSIIGEFAFISPYFQEIHFMKGNKVSRSMQLNMGKWMLSEQERVMLQEMSIPEKDEFISINKKFSGFSKVIFNQDHLFFTSRGTGPVAYDFDTQRIVGFDNKYPAFGFATIVGAFDDKIISTINGEEFYKSNNMLLYNNWKPGLNNDKLFEAAYNHVSELYPEWAKAVELMKNSDNPLLIIGKINFGEPEYEPANFVPNWSNDFNIYVQKHK